MLLVTNQGYVYSTFSTMPHVAFIQSGVGTGILQIQATIVIGHT